MSVQIDKNILIFSAGFLTGAVAGIAGLLVLINRDPKIQKPDMVIDKKETK